MHVEVIGTIEMFLLAGKISDGFYGLWWNKFLGLKLESVVADPVKKDPTLYWWHWGYPTWVTGLSELQLCFWPNPCSTSLHGYSAILLHQRWFC